MYGYRWKGEEYVIEPHEAEVVKEIFSWYLDGRSASSIAKELEGRGVCTRRGNRFTKRVIHNILNQEAYTGQLVLQKTYRPAFGHRSVENKGQMSKYLVEQAHEAIVSQALFKAVQEEKRQRASRRRSKHEGVGLFQGRVYCGQCQLDMIYSLEKKKDGARRIRYSCRTRAKSGVTACSNRTITEEAIVTQLQQQGISPQEIKRLAFNNRTKELIITYRDNQTGVIPLTERTRP
ncbi:MULTISPECIES: recombinase family protein [unclassified Streptococcus]|uniref:recombinase family protein n=1 Tax=unclassified Streptococcus TaxID=2608887 RepID=UPI00359D6435